jgi:lactoylglutathione lyase
MKLAKPHVDVGIITNDAVPMLEFWQETIGLPLEGTLPTGGGNHQHRHAMNGSVFKLNHSRSPVPTLRDTGFAHLYIARPGLAEKRAFSDPEGNAVTLVPPGLSDVAGIGMHLHVSDEAHFDDFFARTLELERLGDRRYRCGDSVISFERAPDLVRNQGLAGRGYRYLTVQVWDCDAEHRRILERGGTEGRAPVTLGDVARISFVRDPDGNWIEISQRASLTGPVR